MLQPTGLKLKHEAKQTQTRYNKNSKTARNGAELWNNLNLYRSEEGRISGAAQKGLERHKEGQAAFKTKEKCCSNRALLILWCSYCLILRKLCSTWKCTVALQQWNVEGRCSAANFINTMLWNTSSKLPTSTRSFGGNCSGRKLWG